MLRLIRIYLIPGAMLQSVMIGGGYGTGREVVEYFTSYGTLGGVFAIGVAAASIAIVFALSLEVTRVFKVYDAGIQERFMKARRSWCAYCILKKFQKMIKTLHGKSSVIEDRHKTLMKNAINV